MYEEVEIAIHRTVEVLSHVLYWLAVLIGTGLFLYSLTKVPGLREGSPCAPGHAWAFTSGGAVAPDISCEPLTGYAPRS